ncbi:GNAT family N-acetyltransferase [candidate division CSSED10-310 bacterium]|uniref:GNAT family N-acetyltransferase n=1 Tax=candidate division CSSED10-310 bacterium TaxID=2855610 RepID=A0ABV6YS37_UNCC1
MLSTNISEEKLMVASKLEIITLNGQNIDHEHICCAIGSDKKNTARAQLKKEWLKQRFPEGHTFKKFNVRGKVFIEYVPAEYAWFPITAPGYVFIQCFWVSGRFKGQGLGMKLLAECERDCRTRNGLVAITSPKKRPFITDKKFLTKFEFQVCDKAEPFFELMVKKFKRNAPAPYFSEKAKQPALPGKKGLTFFYADLCPFNADFVEVMIKTGRKYNIPCEKIKIESLQQAKESPSPWGIFSVFYDDEFLTYEVMTEKKFDNLLQSKLQ